MDMSALPSHLRLSYNPFEPAASGAPYGSELSEPFGIAADIRTLLSGYQSTRGAKGATIVGEYGTGKTCLLYWLRDRELPRRRIVPFYFDNPGVRFYDLANALLRQIGRKDFAKFVWELASPHVEDHQLDLFERGFEAFVRASLGRVQREDVMGRLQRAILDAQIADDEEIADCLARLVTDTVRKPYFEYRDFVPSSSASLVAEREEARYFRAILKTIAKGRDATGIAFLIDEFEEIALQKRLTRRAAHDYLTTVKHLLNIAELGPPEFWIFLSMTPEAEAQSRRLEPSLFERLQGATELQPLTLEAALELIEKRVRPARPKGDEGNDSAFPFPSNIDKVFRPTTYSSPRRLIKTCSFAVAKAAPSTLVPFSPEYLQAVERQLYPSESTST